MGGAVASDGGGGSGRARILVDFKRMNKVMRVDATDQSVRAQSGATLGSVNRALRRRRLFLGHDPWTRDYATVGGAVSTNGLGYYGGRYGTMGDQVLGLQAVLADGTVVDTTPVWTASTGLDLKRLFIGTEGSLGLITEATIRCHAAPEAEVVLAYLVLELRGCVQGRHQDAQDRSESHLHGGLGRSRSAMHILHRLHRTGRRGEGRGRGAPGCSHRRVG